MTRVSVRTGGVEAFGASVEPDISADGRYVTFASKAPLTADDTNGPCLNGGTDCSDIFRHDRNTGTTIRVSVSSAGGQADAGSAAPRISGDGRYVVFESAATSLVAGDTNQRRDITIEVGERGLWPDPMFPERRACRVTVPVPARGRYTTGVKGLCPAIGNGLTFGLIVGGTITSDGPPIVVERSTYWSTSNQFWAAGASTLLTPLP